MEIGTGWYWRRKERKWKYRIGTALVDLIYTRHSVRDCEGQILFVFFVSRTFNVSASSSGETPSRTLAETATERARETALAAKEKAKDLASHAQKKQYVWRTTIVSFDAVSGTDLSLRPYLIVFARVQLTDPSQASVRKTHSSVGWTMKGLSWLQKASFGLAVCISESLASLQ